MFFVYYPQEIPSVSFQRGLFISLLTLISPSDCSYEQSFIINCSIEQKSILLDTQHNLGYGSICCGREDAGISVADDIPPTPSRGSRMISGAAVCTFLCVVAFNTLFIITVLVSKKISPLALDSSEAVLELYSEPTAGLKSTNGRKNVSRELFRDCRRAKRNRTLSMGSPEMINRSY